MMLIIATLLIHPILFSQNYIDNEIQFIKVITLSDSPLPGGENGLITLSSELNKLFSDYRVKKYAPILSTPKREVFANHYIIELSSNAIDFINVLDSLKFFENIRLLEASSTTATCPIPASINDPVLAWGGWATLDGLEASCAWTISKGNPNLKVAVVDADIDISQPDLQGKIPYYEMQGVTNLNNRPIGWTSGSHGTRVLGVIAAQTNNGIGTASVGYNTRCSFYAADNTQYYINPQGASGQPGPSIIRAFDDNNKIISISYNGTGLSTTDAQNIVNNGTLLVVAAGNISGSAYHSSLWNVPGVIIVGQVDESNMHGPTNTSHYAGVDLCAMVKFVTTDENSTYPAFWGTSSCAPQVAGAAALILDVNPCLTPPEIEEIIKSTTSPILDASSFSGLIGTGRLNAYAALVKALTYKAMYEQNKTYIPNSMSYTRRRHTIMLGYSVTGSIPNGWATIQTGASVNYIARNYIETKTGFEAQQGSGFEWRINPDLDVCDGENDGGIDDPIDPGEIGD
ncbi:MAG: S8 family serine peptidase [Bacteroidia bacterium]|nr:S8 family serine peptidase [Bacteroidia bacterium]MCC7534435.1 S8 family serine peptidase [Bacteroidia bacterium]